MWMIRPYLSIIIFLYVFLIILNIIYTKYILSVHFALKLVFLYLNFVSFSSVCHMKMILFDLLCFQVYLCQIGWIRTKKTVNLANIRTRTRHGFTYGSKKSRLKANWSYNPLSRKCRMCYRRVELDRSQREATSR